MELDPQNPLEQAVVAWLDDTEEAGYEAENRLADLLQHGCQSGMVSDLVYYTDTVAFFEKHASDINALLKEAIDSTGLQPAELFGDKWDKEDPLAKDDLNRNLLAWFGFEEAARALCDRAGVDV